MDLGTTAEACLRAAQPTSPTLNMPAGYSMKAAERLVPGLNCHPLSTMGDSADTLLVLHVVCCCLHRSGAGPVLRRGGVCGPVVLLDEVDKMGRDAMRTSAALLEEGTRGVLVALSVPQLVLT